jgi:glucose/mannose-6-phosphate isomerase
VSDAAGAAVVGASPLTLDSIGMWDLTVGLPEQVATARRAAAEADLGDLEREAPISNVVVLGMGGSGIAGDVLAAYAAPRMAVPVTVVKSYELPAFAGGDSLVVAVSCSGDTEETVAAASSAVARGAPFVAVAGGGALSDLAAAARAPCIAVPRDIPQPRAALGAMAVPLLVVLERLGLLPGAGADVDRAAGELALRRDELLGKGSVAPTIAERIGGTTPLVHGSPGLTAVAASRWKTQVNENAKAPAFWSAQPELCHNEIAGWGVNGDVTRQTITLVVLRHGEELPHVAARIALVEELMLEVVADIVEVRAEGSGDLSRFLHHVLIGDLVSLHLAGAAGVDPGPVPVLGEIKQSLQALG